MHYLLIKRLVDIMGSAVALLLLSPIIGLIALLIRLESPGNPVFCHVRVGRGGRSFGLLKFRSMVKNAAAIGPYWTSDHDPRITRFGKFLRRSSLDELPQLWNVLIGDMSLIGPRPEVSDERRLYTQEQWDERLSLRPGITGLAQVSGRSTLTKEAQIDYDLTYVRRVSLAMDMRIILLTIRQLFSRVGVN